jgi:hypothetical protein
LSRAGAAGDVEVVRDGVARDTVVCSGETTTVREWRGRVVAALRRQLASPQLGPCLGRTQQRVLAHPGGEAG